MKHVSWDDCLRLAKNTTWRWTHERKVAFIEGNEWTNRGHWDNWFDPRSGWNYSLQGAVEHEFAEQKYSSQ
jgi:hypothetical protein